MILRILTFALAALTASCGFALTDDSHVETVDTPTKGAWCKYLDETVAAGDADSSPVIVFWASSDCGHCKDMQRAVNSDEFLAWQKANQYYMAFGTGSDFKQYAKYGTQTLSSYPFICVYLPWEDLKVNFSGLDGMMYAGTPGTSLEAQLIASIEAILADHPSYVGGEFSAGGTIGDRLEAEVGYTTKAIVPLVRANARNAAYNLVVARFPNGSEASKDIYWSAGQTEASVTFDIPGSPAEGNVISLLAYDGDNRPSKPATVTFVKRENSPKNPTWSGVSDFGEWTMDLDAAQDFVRNWKSSHSGSKAYTLALIGGSMWCPDCARTDRYLVDTDEFKSWAKSKNVACVAIDIPNWSATAPTTGPCLLTREKKEVSQTYVDADPDHGAVQSGAGYLSRWMISDADAAAKLEANRKLAGRSTLNGGWNRPERSNQYRTGVPVFVLLNDDGTIAGRIETFASQSPGAFMSGYIDRLNELLATAGGSENDVHWKTTGSSLALGGAAGSDKVSGGDLVDVFRLTGVDFTKRTRVTLNGSAPSGLALKLTLFQVASDGKETAYDGNAVDFVESLGDCYAKVELMGLEADADARKFGRSGDATASYTVSAASETVPGEVRFTALAQSVFVPDGTGRVTVERADGRTGVVSVKVYVSDAGTAAGFYDFPETTLTWEAGETGSKEIAFDVFRTDTIASGSFTLALEKIGTSDAEVSSGTHVVTLTDTDKPCFATFENDVESFSGFASVGVFELKNVDPTKSVTIKKVDGTLPSGLKLAYNKKSGMVELSGTAKKSGTYTVSYTVKQGKETGLPATFTFTMEDPADYSPFAGKKRASQDIPMVGEAADTNVLKGVLNVSIDAKNKIKAKLSGVWKKSVTYSGAWQNVDKATGTLSAAIAVKDGSVLEITMDKDGTVSAEIAALGVFGAAAYPETDFSAWVGQYNLTFPDLDEEASGSPYATLTVSANGKVKWSGVMSDGTSMNGSTVLFDRTDGSAKALLVKRASKRAFTALVEIGPDGDVRWNKSTGDPYAPQIVHAVRGTAAGEFDANAEVVSLRQAFGSWYLKNITPTELADTFGYAEGMVLSLGGFGAIALTATDKGFTCADPAVKVSFTKKTGLFSGSAKLTLKDGTSVKATFKGALMPGWDECGACAEDVEAYERPFGSGTMYYKTKIDGKSVTVSAPVDILAGKETED